MSKKLYIWDLANTLFREEWNQKRTGFDSYEKWLENQLGKKMSEISAREEEEMYEIPHKEGWYLNLDIMPGFEEALKMSKNNEVFTAGNPEQVDWRAHYLNPKVGFDVRQWFSKINSTFDYEETNVKNKEMLIKYLGAKVKEGYKTFVYADDKLKNLFEFKEAMDFLASGDKNITYRLYHILNNDSKIKSMDGYREVGNLLGVVENEKKFGDN